MPDISVLSWYDEIKWAIVSEIEKPEGESEEEMVEDGIVGKRCFRYKNEIDHVNYMTILEFTGRSISSPANVKFYVPEMTSPTNIKLMLPRFFTPPDSEHSDFYTWINTENVAQYTNMRFDMLKSERKEMSL